MKISVSLPEEDVAFIDRYVVDANAASRSAVIHRAVELLRHADLEAAYAEAWDDWETGDDAATWEATSADGLDEVNRDRAAR